MVPFRSLGGRNAEYSQTNPMSMNFLREITEYLMRQLDQEQYSVMIENFLQTGEIDESLLTVLFYPIKNPSGAWEDFNPACGYWYRLYGWGLNEMFDLRLMPDFPNAANYSDLNASRSAFFTGWHGSWNGYGYAGKTSA